MPPADNLWVEIVGSIIVARIRGVPTEELIRECQSRIVSLLKDTGCKRVMYDALELERPPVDVALVQQALTAALTEPTMRIAIVVSNTRVAYLARLAFGDANHRVFYNEMPAALRWLDEKDSPVSDKAS
jgi:hypothetical protein